MDDTSPISSPNIIKLRNHYPIESSFWTKRLQKGGETGEILEREKWKLFRMEVKFFSVQSHKMSFFRRCFNVIENRGMYWAKGTHTQRIEVSNGWPKLEGKENCGFVLLGFSTVHCLVHVQSEFQCRFLITLTMYWQNGFRKEIY